MRRSTLWGWILEMESAALAALAAYCEVVSFG
jgi:hypothetical protein